MAFLYQSERTTPPLPHTFFRLLKPRYSTRPPSTRRDFSFHIIVQSSWATVRYRCSMSAARLLVAARKLVTRAIPPAAGSYRISRRFRRACTPSSSVGASATPISPTSARITLAGRGLSPAVPPASPHFILPSKPLRYCTLHSL